MLNQPLFQVTLRVFGNVLSIGFREA